MTKYLLKLATFFMVLTLCRAMDIGEWRAFWTLEKTTDYEYSIFNFRYSKPVFGPEKRTDIYYVLPDDRFGLKLRKEKELELKIKPKSFDNGIEIWEKVLKKNIKDESDILQKLQKKSKKHDHDRHDAIKFCSKLYEENQANLLKIKVEKTRWQPHPWVEETDIICKTMDDKIIGTFRSVSFMTNDDKFSETQISIVEDIKHEVKNPFYGGYPAFLIQLSKNEKYEMTCPDEKIETEESLHKI